MEGIKGIKELRYLKGVSGSCIAHEEGKYQLI